jgi:hypothetical protein
VRMKVAALALVAALLAVPAGLMAQEQPPPQSPQLPTPEQVEAAQRELPVSVERIRRKLAQAPATKTDGLRLDYYVEVYGRYSKVDLFADIDTKSGAVQYGSPTHTEFLNLVTPQEFKSPPADLMTPTIALMKWLAEKAGKKQDPSRPDR